MQDRIELTDGKARGQMKYLTHRLSVVAKFSLVPWNGRDGQPAKILLDLNNIKIKFWV